MQRVEQHASFGGRQEVWQHTSATLGCEMTFAVDLPPATDKDLPPTVEDAVALIDERSPRMAQAVEERRSLSKQYASQTGTFLPHVSLLVQGNHKYDVQGATGLTRDARAMVQLTYSVNGGADYATRHRISARMREADYEVERRRREVEADLRADFEALKAARSKIATINSEIEEAAKWMSAALDARVGDPREVDRG